MPLSTRSALIALIIIQSVMLFSLFAGVEPHPPAKLPFFGMAPFLAAALSAAACALMQGKENGGRALSLIAVLTAMLSYGPHKFFDPAFADVWPSVVAAQIAALLICFNLIRSFLPAK